MDPENSPLPFLSWGELLWKGGLGSERTLKVIEE